MGHRGNTAVVLFTRDLRIRDQPALSAAARDAKRVVPAFVLDDALLRGPCGAPNRLAFLAASLADLDRSLRQRGGRLVVRRGEVVAEALKVVTQCGAEALYVSGDVSAYAQRRQRLLGAACERERIGFHVLPGVAVVEPGAVRPAGGDHYRVFTPYWRAWQQAPRRRVLAGPRRLTRPAVESDSLPGVEDLCEGRRSARLPPGGETAGRELLRRWLQRDAQQYERNRDSLAAGATSRLAPYLHFGCLSANEVLDRVRGVDREQAFARQLCWRDFHHQVLEARPDLPYADYRPRGDRWRRNQRLAEAWRRGRTGYPIVDAGLRQLAREGFMHNRARLISASFLTKLLYLDWRLGAAHFYELLVDGDLACNVGNWQWVAGTGNDTRPNRVLNPLRQAHRFDPDGDYVRRYVPELEEIEGRAVHEPWRLEPRLLRRTSYPKRIVEHGEAAQRLLRRRSRTGAR